MHKIKLEATVDLTTSNGAELLSALVSICEKTGGSATLSISGGEQGEIPAPKAGSAAGSGSANAKKAVTDKEDAKAKQLVAEVEETPGTPEEPANETPGTPEEPANEAHEILDFSHGKISVERENEIRELQRAILKAKPGAKDKAKAKLNGYGADTLTQLFETRPDVVLEYESFLKTL